MGSENVYKRQFLTQQIVPKTILSGVDEPVDRKLILKKYGLGGPCYGTISLSLTTVLRALRAGDVDLVPTFRIEAV